MKRMNVEGKIYEASTESKTRASTEKNLNEAPLVADRLPFDVRTNTLMQTLNPMKNIIKWNFRLWVIGAAFFLIVFL